MNLEQIPSVQKWLPYQKILEKGIIKLKDLTYVKILKIIPINYNLKSELEKQAILNSYTNLFKTTNFNLQILIQSKKEDLSKNIQILSKVNAYEELQKNYIQFILNLNKTKKSSSKNYYLIIKESTSEKEESIKIENLQNEYLKIKECLSRCQNQVIEYTNKDEILKIIYSFLNSNKD